MAELPRDGLDIGLEPDDQHRREAVPQPMERERPDDISPLVAATLAAWGACGMPDDSNPEIF